MTEQVLAEDMPPAAGDAGDPAPMTPDTQELAAVPPLESGRIEGLGTAAEDAPAGDRPDETAVAEAEAGEPPDLVEGPADVTAAFLLLLGRQPSPPTVFETMQSLTLVAMMHRISGGAEFRDRVAAMLLIEEPLPHERGHRSKALPLVDWLAARFQLSPGRRARMSRVRSWRELLGLLAHDPMLAPKIFASSILTTLAQMPAPPIALVDIEEPPHTEAPVRAEGREAEPEPPALPDWAVERLASKLDADDVAALLIVTLGRVEQNPVTIGIGKRLAPSLFKLVHSGDFDERILASLIERQRLPQDMEHPRLERALARWAAERLPVSEASEPAVLAAESYYELLLALLADPLFVESAFPLVLDRPKMLYLRHRVATAVAARGRREDPGLPILSDVVFIPDPPALTGLVQGRLSSEAPTLRALLDGPDSIALRGRVVAEGDRLGVRVELPLAVLDGQNWFARLILQDSKREVLAARRFAFRLSQRAPAPQPPPAAAPLPPAAATAILGTTGRVVVASVPPALDSGAVRLSVGGEMLAPAAIAAPAAETPDAPAHLAFIAPAGLMDEPALLVAPDAAGLPAPLSEPLPCTTEDAPLTGLAIGPGATLEGHDTDPAGLKAGRIFTLDVDGVPHEGRGPALSTEPLLAPFGAATRFAFMLPPAVLDGAPHELIVHASAGEARREVARLGFTFDAVAFSALLRRAADEAQRTALLDLAADLGRLDLLSDALAESVLGECEPLHPTRTIGLLLRAFARRPMESMDHPLRRLFELLWRQAAGSAAEADTLFGHLADVLMRAGDADERRVLANTQLKDAAVDFLLARWKRDAKGANAARIAGPLLTLGRPGLAEMVIADGLKAAPRNLDLLAVQARLSLSRGEFEAAGRTVAEVLAGKPDHAEAVSIRARLLQAEGDHLGAIALATGRRGVVAVRPTGAPEVRHARQALPLGWLHWARRAFDADPEGEIACRLDSAIALQGGPLPAAERGFSVLYLPPQLRKGGYRTDFEAYGPECLMVTRLDDSKLGGAPVIGPWALVLAADRRLPPLVIGAVLAERRPAVGVVRLLQSGKSGAVLAGLLLRAEHVLELGEADLAQSDALLRDRLRAITFFMPG